MSSPSLWQKTKDYISPQKASVKAAAITQTSQITPGVAGRPSTVFSEEKNQLGPQIITHDATNMPKMNALDYVTKAAGSSWVFVVMMVLVVVWAVFGFIVQGSDTWQILFQNVSSVQVYLTDILLLRQASNAQRGLLTTLAELQSRNQSCDRLLRSIPGCQWMETHRDPAKQLQKDGVPIEDTAEDALLTGQNLSKLRLFWNYFCAIIAGGLGSIYAFVFYWIGIGLWIAIGPIFQFSDTWQLYVNTATAVSLTFTSVFLQNIQQQQEDNLERCLEYAIKVDAEVEWRLRSVTGDTLANPVFEIQPPRVGKIDRAIDVFADVMGSGVGLALTLAAFIVWFAIGPMLEFNDNWFLIMGTFTGLVGFIDGFVLRNVYHRDEKVAEVQFQEIEASDDRLLDLLNIPAPYYSPPKIRNCGTRASIAAGEWTAKSSVSVGSVGVVVALLAAATAMQWSETGQLLCNTPTMIVEGFLLLILIQAHSTANVARGLDFSGLLKRRMLLNHYVCELNDEQTSIINYYSKEKSLASAFSYPSNPEDDEDMQQPATWADDRV